MRFLVLLTTLLLLLSPGQSALAEGAWFMPEPTSPDKLIRFEYILEEAEYTAEIVELLRDRFPDVRFEQHPELGSAFYANGTKKALIAVRRELHQIENDIEYKRRPLGLRSALLSEDSRLRCKYRAEPPSEVYNCT